MLSLPARFAAVILCFAPLLRERSWRHAEVLLIGAILVPGRRTVTGILRIAGLARERRFVNYHRILSRAAWSGRAAAHVSLGLLLDAFAPRGPVVLGLDDTILLELLCPGCGIVVGTPGPAGCEVGGEAHHDGSSALDHQATLERGDTPRPLNLLDGETPM
jgi:DDE superfamily endonuclease